MTQELPEGLRVGDLFRLFLDGKIPIDAELMPYLEGRIAKRITEYHIHSNVSTNRGECGMHGSGKHTVMTLLFSP